jgi:c-di-GMP-related signal transduction protein
MGLPSLMDAILEVPMGVVLEGIGLDQETRAVLLHQKSQHDLVYQLMLAQEAANWPTLSQLCAQLQLPETHVIDCHWKAMQWVREMTSPANSFAVTKGSAPLSARNPDRVK